MHIKKILVTGVFGSFGAIFRFLIYEIMSVFVDVPSFYSTMVVNVIGSFLLSYCVQRQLTTLNHNEFLSGLAHYKTEILGGLIGAFTTFSTVIYEISLFNHSGDYLRCFIYIFCAITLALFAVFFGEILAQKSNIKNNPDSMQILPVMKIGDSE
ncbi:Putative fluoride ion transporter CrcB [Candidatus Lokiarchaeum ossiferum]|uniref:Fluoride-specific ion channel n=1 Tax=Candidatus Lokiarchaeum ossiferum TaxID=2951803 RepID=A0ABY6HZ92_9ARCH|nr:Putative fluoride ion transporter CrcB [Candidatus Lokiarchaeum sp. B-35]